MNFADEARQVWRDEAYVTLHVPAECAVDMDRTSMSPLSPFADPTRSSCSRHDTKVHAISTSGCRVPTHTCSPQQPLLRNRAVQTLTFDSPLKTHPLAHAPFDVLSRPCKRALRRDPCLCDIRGQRRFGLNEGDDRFGVRVDGKLYSQT